MAPRSLASLACCVAAAAASGCVVPAAPSGRDGAAAAREQPMDPALLSRLRLAVAEAIYNEPEVAPQAPRLQAALRRAAAREGFAVTSGAPAPGDLVLRPSFEWTPLGRAIDPRLFITVVLERDGERIDEVMLQQQEGFPQTDAELEAMVAALPRQLARSPRTQAYLKELP
jgi:hypothetical protein